MENNEGKYYKCNKCGQTLTEGTYKDGTHPMCTASAFYRTSGICGGGSISTEITKEEYDATILNWEKQRKANG